MLIAIFTFCILLLMLSLAAVKWELKTKHFLPWSVAMAAFGSGLTYIASLALPGVPAVLFALASVVIVGFLSIAAILFFFFRDPERHPPASECVVVSPADGTVVYVKQIEGGEFPFAVKKRKKIMLAEFSQADLIPNRGLQIGIAMNYLDVHVNRSPIAGKVTMLKAIGGRFLSLKHLHALLENERTLMVFENANLKVGIVQIASRLVRRIVPYVCEGQSVEQGQRVGMIRFGSQVDLLIPYRDDLEVKVRVGDEVTAGESVLITCDPNASLPRGSHDAMPGTENLCSLP